MNNINFVKKINIDKQPPLMPILIVQGKITGYNDRHREEIYVSVSWYFQKGLTGMLLSIISLQSHVLNSSQNAR